MPATTGVGFIEQVEHPAVGIPLTQRVRLRLRVANRWVIDSLLPCTGCTRYWRPYCN